MTDGHTRAFEPEDLAFFGAITAGISHELKNVATIINESAGLLNDLSLGAESGRRPLDPSRIKKMSSDISRNVDRAVAILNRMNRFAHSVDEPRRPADLKDILDDTVELAKRFSSVRGVDLQATLPEHAVPVNTYVFGMHRALFTALQLIVLDVDGVLPAQVSLSKQGTSACVRMHRGAWVASDEAATRRQALARLMGVLGGEVRWEADDTGRQGLVLHVPADAGE
jgi:signal transduction histidine kinase